MPNDLPPWLTTTETARQVLFWMMRQPDRTLHELQFLFENAELPEHYRGSVLRLPWRGSDQYLVPGRAK